MDSRGFPEMSLDCDCMQDLLLYILIRIIELDVVENLSWPTF